MSPTCNPCFFFNSIDALSVSLRTVTRVVNLILAPTQTKLVRKRKENRKTKKNKEEQKKKTKIAGSSLNIPHSPVFSIGF